MPCIQLRPLHNPNEPPFPGLSNLSFRPPKNRTPTPTFDPLSPIHKPVHPDLRPRPGDDALLEYAFGARGRARMAPRDRAAATTPRRVDRLLALYEAPRDARTLYG